MRRYYFDYNATTPVSAEVLQAMTPVMAEVYGNASSVHHFGQLARQRLDEASSLLNRDMLGKPTGPQAGFSKLVVSGIRPWYFLGNSRVCFCLADAWCWGPDLVAHEAVFSVWAKSRESGRC